MKRLERAEWLVEYARKAGADDAEAFVSDRSSVEIMVANEKPESVNQARISGFGLRVIVDGRMGFASSNDLEREHAESLIKNLITNTRLHTPDEHNVLPDPVDGAMNSRTIEQFDEALAHTPIEEKIQKAVAIDSAARGADKRIVNIAWLQYGDNAEEYAIVSSKGIRGEARRSNAYGFAWVAAMEAGADGAPDPATAQTGMGIEYKTHFNALDATVLGHKAAGYALRMLGAGPGKTGEVEGVFPPEAGHHILGLIGTMISADLVQKKKSLLAGKLGEMIASEHVTVIDDGRYPGGLASAAVDGEGVPTSAKEIIKNGKLVQFLYDSYTAHRGDTVPTGNASRESFDDRPVIAPTNLYLQPGKASHDDIVASVANGFYVTELNGLHASVDPITGDFSIPSKGLLIRNGELAKPADGITISGSVFAFLKSIDQVGSDLTWEVESHVIGIPTFKVAGLKITGK